MVVVTENTRKLFAEAERDRHLVRYYTARHDTLRTLHFDKVSWDDIGRDRRLCAYSTQNIHSYKRVLGRAHYHII
jgi:hypothetical protein